MQRVTALRKRIREFERRRDRDFPLTVAEFESKPEDVQRRVVLILTAEQVQRDRLMQQYQLSWRQVEPLVKEFRTNVWRSLLSTSPGLMTV